MAGKLYITTSIPYVNARPHIGFALELVQTDTYARYCSLRGDQVWLQTGTDDNAFKNVVSANEQGVPVRQFVDRNAKRFQELLTALNIGVDGFVRTASPEHHEAAQSFISRLRSDDIYQATYSGLYCNGCEDFYRPRDLIDGKCPHHAQTLEEVKEDNYFFRLSSYRNEIARLIESGCLRVVPDTRRLEILRFLDGGINDISLSRDSARSGDWGVPFPGDDSQVIYVWIEALVNYLSGIGFPHANWRTIWNGDYRKVHVIGKDIWKFHAIYWPALLLSADLPLPDQILIHGFLNVDGHKISKSRGTAADPFSYVDRFGADPLRFFLLRHVTPFGDSNFSERQLAESYQADLADGLGNLVARVSALCAQAGVGDPDPKAVPAVPRGVHEALEACRFDRALKVLWDDIGRLNREINDGRPWELIRSRRMDQVRPDLERWIRDLKVIGYWLQPFLPATGSRVIAAFSQSYVQRVEPLFPKEHQRSRGEA